MSPRSSRSSQPARSRRPEAPPRLSSPGLFEKAFHNSPALHSIVRLPEAVLVEVNETFLRTFGYSREELLGKSPLELNFWVYPEKLKNYRVQLLSEGFVRNFETEVRTKGGAIRTILLSSDVVEIEGVKYSLSAGVDITARKRGEQIQQATFQISEAALAAEDLNALYTRIHETVNGLMPARNFYIALFDETSGLISFPYFVDERSDRPEPFPLNTGLTGYVVRTGKSLLMDPAMNARKQKLRGKVSFKGYKELSYVESGKPAATWLGVPLTVQGRTIGVMAVQDYRDGSAYGAEEKRILEFVAAQTALAIDRKRAAEALRESEQKFRALFEGSSQGVLIQENERFVDVNSATLRILGYKTPTAILGKHPRETSPPFQPDGETSDAAAARHMAKCMTTGSARFDWVGVNAQGKEVPFEVILTKLELGGRHLIQAVINDISERKKAEAAMRASEARLRESEARFSTAFNASPALISIARLRDGRYVEVNDALLRWTGLKKSELLGRNSVETGLWASSDERARFFAALEARRSLRDVECQFRRQDGAHTMLVSADVIEINGEPHVLGFGLDITQLKRAQVELEKALQQERDLNKLKSDFVSVVSHEFRTPLEVIMSSADNLERYHDRLQPEKRRQLLQTINKSVGRMAGMMEEVLVLGRAESGRMDFVPVSFDLHSFCQRVGDEVASVTARRCPIQVRFGQIPATANGDENILRHILSNLLVNAVKYSAEGKPVTLSLSRKGAEAILKVEDKGVGIPAADQQGLFQAFHRGSNVQHIPGTGLGLVVVQRCVTLHGGTIRCDSSEGQGTTFTVKLPLFK